MNWYKGKVLHGEKAGRTIGFPTVNLDPSIIPQTTKQGVYASQVKIDEKIYKGALYFGPRLVKGETHVVLEIHIINFDDKIYGKNIEFTLEKFIRPVLNFDSIELLKEQIKKDILVISSPPSGRREI